MSNLPVSDKYTPRPVYVRHLWRKHFMDIDPPTDEEKADAIKVLRECYPPIWEIDELLLQEAELIFVEAGEEVS